MKARAASLAIALAALACGGPVEAAEGSGVPAQRGLVRQSAAVSPGYVLFSPLLSNVTYLIDNAGRVVHTWTALTSPGGDQILLDDGSLLRLGRDLDFTHFRTGGVGGWIERLGWDGEELWAWNFASARAVLHHDIERLPNGNVLALAWEAKSPAEAARAGRRADRIPPQGLWPDWVLEVKPEPPRGGRVVWEWHVWDHLAQPQGVTGEPSEYPGRLDINAGAPKATVTDDELAQLKALGYVPDDAQANDLDADFLHVNAIDYHPGLDQIALSVPALGEVWILDHGTTRAEAASSRGGKRGRGGELLYRWGNAERVRPRRRECDGARLSARRALDPERLSRRGAPDGLQQPRGRPRREGIVGARDRTAAARERPLRARGGGAVRAARAELALPRRSARGILRALHLRRTANAHGQHADLRRPAGAPVRGYAGRGDRLGVLESVRRQRAPNRWQRPAARARRSAVRGVSRHAHSARSSRATRSEPRATRSSAADSREAGGVNAPQRGSSTITGMSRSVRA